MIIIKDVLPIERTFQLMDHKRTGVQSPFSLAFVGKKISFLALNFLVNEKVDSGL
jgi:hypothetical protein